MEKLVTGFIVGDKEVELYTYTRQKSENYLTIIGMSFVVALIAWIFTVMFYQLYTEHSADLALSGHYSRLLGIFAAVGALSTFSLVFSTTRFLTGEGRVLKTNHSNEELMNLAKNPTERPLKYSIINSIRLLTTSDSMEEEETVESEVGEKNLEDEDLNPPINDINLANKANPAPHSNTIAEESRTLINDKMSTENTMLKAPEEYEGNAMIFEYDENNYKNPNDNSQEVNAHEDIKYGGVGAEASVWEVDETVMGVGVAPEVGIAPEPLIDENYNNHAGSSKINETHIKIVEPNTIETEAYSQPAINANDNQVDGGETLANGATEFNSYNGGNEVNSINTRPPLTRREARMAREAQEQKESTGVGEETVTNEPINFTNQSTDELITTEVNDSYTNNENYGGIKYGLLGPRGKYSSSR